MSIEKTKEELHEHRSSSIKILSDYLKDLIDSDDKVQKGKADKLSYWLKDWTRFLNFESQFTPMSLRRYKRGEIVKVHLGFNVGSEEGGLHYAVVLDKNNAKSSPVITIVPLTSAKPGKELGTGRVFLGNELFTSLNAKLSATHKHLVDETNLLSSLVQTCPPEELDELEKRLKKSQREIDMLFRTKKEISRMKQGSVALVSQITTVSKIRIYDPRTDYDVLSNIKLSNEKLDLIDKEIVKNYTNYE